MELLLLRHAEAAPAGGSDSDRPLTSEGRRVAERLGRGLARLDLAPEGVYSSPLLRARETADCVMEGLGRQRSLIQICPELEPGATPARIMKLLEGRPTSRRTMLVGHQPDMGRMLSFVLSGGSMELEFSIRPATVCVAEIDSIPLRAPGRLILLAGPAVLGHLE
jgi:phosphohistidine phosphatase